MKKKAIYSLVMVIVLVAGLIFYAVPAANAAWNPNDIINDGVFDKTGSMTISTINNFLNSFGSSCISPNNGFLSQDPTGYTPSGGFTYGGNVTAGQVIYDASLAYGVNPQVLLVTLQKEQSLVTGGAGCTVLGYTGAMGYGCPDSGGGYNYSGVDLYNTGGNEVTAVNGTCVNSAAKAGFSQQVIHAAWLLKFGEERSEGNINFDVTNTNYPQPGDVWNNSDDPQSCYGGPMTQGTFQTCPGSSAVYYDGWTTIDGTATHMDTGATASLYYYTPHFSGNENFYNLFVSWFGNPTSSCIGTSNLSGVPSGGKVIAYQDSGGAATNLAYTQLNNTGSTCAEVHVWNYGYQTWGAHIATGMQATYPSIGTLIPLHSSSANKDLLAYILYNGAGGAVEVHEFSPDLQTFPGFYDTSTNLGDVSATSGQFVAGDFFGRGTSQLVYVLYNDSNGYAEVHMFNPSMTQGIGYYDVVTDLTGVSATSGTFVAGDFLGRGYDQLAYVLFNGSTGNVEVHLFNPSLTKAIGFYDVKTDLTGVSATSGQFVAGDFLGRGYDQLAYVLDDGGSGMTEVHLFNPSLTQAIGYQDIATNLPGFSPTQ